jgi:hypothetical protein
MNNNFLKAFGLVLFGMLVDFLFNGVLKIIWIPVYGTAYLAIAATIYNYGVSHCLQAAAKYLVLFFFAGTLLGHLIFTGITVVRTYSMEVVSASPLQLHSNDFSDNLFLASDAINQALAQNPGKPVPVDIEVVENYGCIASFKISRVASVDVAHDPNSFWVWKQAGGSAPTNSASAGMDVENQRKPWCRIHWF